MPPPKPDDPALDARVHLEFPVGSKKMLLRIKIFMVPPGLPVPLPPDLPLPAPLPIVISQSDMHVTDIQFGTAPTPDGLNRLPSIAFFGKIVSSAVPSPFGMLVGGACMASAAFDITDPHKGEARFTFLSATVAGNHIAAAMEAKGRIKLVLLC